MQTIPVEIYTRYDGILKQRRIPPSLWNDYRKWLRYFLDFISKYPPSPKRAVQVKLFSDKLRSKGQSEQRIEQAADAVSLFFAVQWDCPTGRLSVQGPAFSVIVQESGESPHDKCASTSGETAGKNSGMVCEIPGPPTGLASSNWRGRRFVPSKTIKELKSPLDL